MAKKILITGGTGFIGQGLVEKWLLEGHEVFVLTRRPKWAQERWKSKIVAISDVNDITQPIDVLVNLAGEGIADKPWSEKRKRLLRQSRIDLTNNLVAWAKNTGQSFNQVISGSAVGFYGQDNGCELDENSLLGKGFAAELCHDWEQAAHKLSDFSQQLCIIRTGVVLGAGGGMMARLALPFKLGLGGRIGSGHQYLPWIHIDDERRAIDFLISNQISGTYNLCAPNPVTNLSFTKKFAKVLKRPAILPIPSWAIKRLLGEMGGLLLDSQRVVPNHLQEKGFKFLYSDIEQALTELS